MELSVVKKLTHFFAAYSSREYKKGEVLIRASHEPEGIYFLEKGMVEQYGLSIQGNKTTLNVFKPVSFFSMMWALGKEPNEYYFEVMSTVATLRLVPKEKVLTLLRSEPEILMDLLVRVYRGIDGLFFQMQALKSGSAYAKLVSVLLISAQRFGIGDSKSTKIILVITEKDLASYAGIQRETVSRLLQKLFKKNIVKKERGALVILNAQQLKDELQY